MFCYGMALRYANLNVPVNSLKAKRAPVDEFAVFLSD